MTDRVERNKQNGMAFYDLMFNQCRPREAIEKYTGATYTQHNPLELWDVLQVVPDTAANSNSMF